MIRGIFSAVGAIIIAILLVRVVLGQMSIVDVAVRALVIMVVISLIDKVVAPLVGAAIRGLNVIEDADPDDANVSSV